MQVTKQQIVNGVVKYSKNEIIPKVTDKTFRMIVSTATTMLEMNPDALTKWIDHPVVSSVLMENNGYYDVDMLEEALERTLEEYGDFSVKFPGIRFLSPEEKELNFSAADVKKLKAYINE